MSSPKTLLLIEMRNNAPAAKYVVVDHSIDGILKLAKVKNVILKSNKIVSTQPSTSALISERNSNSDDLPNVALWDGIYTDDNDDPITSDKISQLVFK